MREHEDEQALLDCFSDILEKAGLKCPKCGSIDTHHMETLDLEEYSAYDSCFSCEHVWNIV